MHPLGGHANLTVSSMMPSTKDLPLVIDSNPNEKLPEKEFKVKVCHNFNVCVCDGIRKDAVFCHSNIVQLFKHVFWKKKKIGRTVSSPKASWRWLGSYWDQNLFHGKRQELIIYHQKVKTLKLTHGTKCLQKKHHGLEARKATRDISSTLARSISKHGMSHCWKCQKNHHLFRMKQPLIMQTRWSTCGHVQMKRQDVDYLQIWNCWQTFWILNTVGRFTFLASLQRKFIGHQRAQWANIQQTCQ